jgi:hypothetical protein
MVLRLRTEWPQSRALENEGKQRTFGAIVAGAAVLSFAAKAAGTLGLLGGRSCRGECWNRRGWRSGRDRRRTFSMSKSLFSQDAGTRVTPRFIIGWPLCRRPVQLEHVLCQIDADDANVSHGCPLLQLEPRHRKLGTLRCCQGRAASTPSPLCAPPKRFAPFEAGL